jgi:hypothetical protein
MGRGPQPFRDVTRFVKAIRKAGVEVERYEYEPSGKVTAFVAGKPITITENTLSADDELARWRGKRNANRT